MPVRLFGFKSCQRRKDREWRALAKARDQLSQEVDLVELLRFMRLFKKVIYKSHSLEDQETSVIDSSLSKNCRFNVIELSDSDIADKDETLQVESFDYSVNDDSL